MSNTYSTKPFVSHDGVDEKGVRAEVKVVTGYGNIAKIEASDAGKSFKVSFSVENTKFDPAGWAPDGSNVLDKIKEAEAAGEPLHFRIETRRKPSIDRSVPIAGLADLAHAKDNIFKSISAVKAEGDDDWTVSPHAVTNMAEDPAGNGSGLYSANSMPKDQLNSGKAATSGNANYSNAFEPAPYVTKMKDGTINPGSMAVAVPLNLIGFVAEWDRDHQGDVTAQVGEKKRVTVAKILLSAANELQIKIFDGSLETPDLGAGSHTRARALLFEVTRSYYPLGSEVVESKESLLEWKKNIVEKSLAMWKWSISEVDTILK